MVIFSGPDETLKHSPFDAMISALDEVISAPGAEFPLISAIEVLV